LKLYKVTGLSAIIAVSLVTSASAQDKTFKTDPKTGVTYRFVKHDLKGTKPAEGDVARVFMLWKGKNSAGTADSIFLDSHKKGDSLGTVSTPLKTTFRGCLEQGILMMAPGDSAVFHVNSDSLFTKTFHFPAGKPLPPYIKTNPTFTFYIKMVSFQNEQELMNARLEKIQAMKSQEGTEIATYLQKNNLNVTPDADSIYYLQTTKGPGRQVKEGDSLEIRYTGMFLDGKVFDKSNRGVGKGTFKILYTRQVPLIKGWVNILGKMNEGDKVRVLIPSSMAYGSHGYGGSIQPYTPLIFDMELVSIIANK
jgi:FKBP-type peptidyl-prolyl cis-trans isomerase FkpA